METPKKVWEKPQLVILGRGRPEERVLEVCKNPQGGIYPTNNEHACHQSALNQNCATCQGAGPS